MTPARVVLIDVIVPALLGAMVTAGFAPWNCYPLALLALVGLLALWRRVDVWRAAWRGFLFGCVYFGTGLYWLYVALHAHAGWPAALSVLAVVLLVAYLAAYSALAGVLAALTRGLPAIPWALLVVPAAWGLCELARGWVGSGFPWLSLGYVTIAAPLNGLAPLLGVHGLSVALVMAAGTLWLLYTGSLPARLLALALVVGFPVLIWAVPSPAPRTPAAAPLAVAVIQGDPAAPAGPGAPATALRRYRALTLRSTGADLVVWPEVAVAAPSAPLRDALTSLGQTLAGRGQTLLAGVLRGSGRPGGGLYNSVRALGAGQGTYDKRHLVPFAETLPVPAWLSRWLFGGGRDALRPGAARQPPIVADGVRLGVSIGFEDVFARAVRRTLPAAGVLVNVADDAWFTGTPGPAQHLEIARMRALESGRPLIRAANRGISALIGFDGGITARAPAGQSWRLVGTVTPRRGLTPFARYGNAPLWWGSGGVVLGALLAAAVVGARRRRRQALWL